jgi:hypothetical protein
MHEAWSWRKVKRKTDRDDALKLAKMAALGELPTVPMPSKKARLYRGLVADRDRLVGRRTAARNRIRALAQRLPWPGPSCPGRTLACALLPYRGPPRLLQEYPISSRSRMHVVVVG